jgi:hypothetical protein
MPRVLMKVLFLRFVGIVGNSPQKTGRGFGVGLVQS